MGICVLQLARLVVIVVFSDDCVGGEVQWVMLYGYGSMAFAAMLVSDDEQLRLLCRSPSRPDS